MENPCHKCIVRPNCTAICFEKENYTKLLKNAISQYGNKTVITNPAYNKKYRKYLKIDGENHIDIMNINSRMRKLQMQD